MYKLYFISLFFLLFPILSNAEIFSLTPSSQGISKIEMNVNGEKRNIIDKNCNLGPAIIKFCSNGKEYLFDTRTKEPDILFQGKDSIQLFWQLDEGMRLYQNFSIKQNRSITWDIIIFNRKNQSAKILDLAFYLPILGISDAFPAKENFNRHASINGDASFLYWAPFTGQGQHIIMLPNDGTSLEYYSDDKWFYIHSSTSVDRTNDSWRIPSSTRIIKSFEKIKYSFKIFTVPNRDAVCNAIYENGGMIFQIVPGMVIPQNTLVNLAIQSKHNITSISPEHKKETKLSHQSSNTKIKLLSVEFERLGENLLTINYANNKVCYLDFFITEPLKTLICKRAAFITEFQQHKDTTKWYNGLYSIYDMERGELLSPDYLQDLKEDFMVGGSDDPSNSKPMYISEKNVLYPDSLEIASLEYYERNFVWGKLQRTEEEYPYPYGIYGSENWFRNRNGLDGDYNSGGSGRERMWRTFDYTTHMAIYYNLFRIAENNPNWVTYLNADGYLDRAYHTAMAFFKIPYNILMGEQWAFHGWCDWAYKQGNFHERYLLDILKALEERGRQEDANKLRREWEKKVTYMIYEDEWPFGSEMFVDRTAFESSYYIAEYALTTPMTPQEQFWYDKNKKRWYSYTKYDEKKKYSFIQNQLDANLALRGIYEPNYQLCGTAWTDGGGTLEYMSQMGGVALLDYAVRFSNKPYEYIRYGYNSLLSSWALMNTGTEDSNFGYWYPGKNKDGAAGWAFCIYQHSHPYMRYIDIGRGPWRYDGEIDHGFTGGIHGAGIYIVQDPIFGNICYGGKMTISSNNYIVTPYDGAGRYLAIPDANRFEIKLYNNGMSDTKEQIISTDLNKITLNIEKRGESNEQRIFFKNLPKGKWKVKLNNKFIKEYVVESNILDINIKYNSNTFTIEMHNIK